MQYAIICMHVLRILVLTIICTPDKLNGLIVGDLAVNKDTDLFNIKSASLLSSHNNTYNQLLS